MLGLWTQAALAARSGVQPGMVAGAAVLGLIVIVVGHDQRDLLVGSAHVVIEVLHLLSGSAPWAWPKSLATRAKARLAAVA